MQIRLSSRSASLQKRADILGVTHHRRSGRPTWPVVSPSTSWSEPPRRTSDQIDCFGTMSARAVCLSPSWAASSVRRAPPFTAARRRAAPQDARDEARTDWRAAIPSAAHAHALWSPRSIGSQPVVSSLPPWKRWPCNCQSTRLPRLAALRAPGSDPGPRDLPSEPCRLCHRFRQVAGVRSGPDACATSSPRASDSSPRQAGRIARTSRVGLLAMCGR
jgi:hypothetical protein